MPNAADLKPCPLCPTSVVRIVRAGPQYQVACDTCGLHTGCRDSEESVTELWNTRPHDTTASSEGDRSVAECVSAIDYAIELGIDGQWFLRAWREGDQEEEWGVDWRAFQARSGHAALHAGIAVPHDQGVAP